MIEVGAPKLEAANKTRPGYVLKLSTCIPGKSPGTDDGMSRNRLSLEVSFDQSKGVMPMIV